MRGKTVGQWLVLVVVLGLISIIATVSSVALFTLANYSDTVERLVSNIKINEPIETKKELIRLHYFYELSKKWKIQWLVDKYLFEDSPFYQIADSYLVRNWQNVIDDLKDKQDDPRAYIYGNAKFRRAQAQYQAGQTKEALNLVLTEIAADFEKALRNCLDSGVIYNECFDRVWNYDLASNKKDAEEALKNPQGTKPKFILGPIKDKNAPPMPVPNDKDKKGDGKEGEDKGGQGSPRKRP